MLCRDRCGYCTFAKAPARLTSPYLTPDEVLSVAQAGRDAGCHEALFTLGERPELRYPVAARGWPGTGTARRSSTWRRCAGRRVDETGLLPHANAGALYADELAVLRPVGEPGHDARVAGAGSRGAPWRTRQGAGARLATLEAAGELGIPFTTGILVGIGDTRADQLAALRAIAASHARHGHVQEVIVQNFLPKPGTAMFRAAPCPPDDLVWAIAAARLVLPPSVHVQAPPNLSDDLAPLLDAGIDDWGGVSPVTADHVNPERAWPALDVLRAATESAGHVLAPRLTVYPTFALDPTRWLAEEMRFPVLDASDAEGLARDAGGAGGARRRRRRCSSGPRVAHGPGAAARCRGLGGEAPWPRSWPAWVWVRRWASRRS